MKGGSRVVVEPHRHEGIFVARGKEDALVTLNGTPGVAVYGEKRISVEVPPVAGETVPTKVEYRVWNPFRSKRKLRVVAKRKNCCYQYGIVSDPLSYLLYSCCNHSRWC